MVRITATAFLAFGCLLSGEAARAGLKPMTRGGVVPQGGGAWVALAGRFQFERWVEEQRHFVGRFIGQVPSCEGHPNTKDLGEGSGSCYFSNEEFRPEVGKTYCLILTDGSKSGMTIVAHGPDDAETAKELREVIESPSAFENDATWRKRRALWARVPEGSGTG